MPRANHFRHQTYTDGPPSVPYFLLQAVPSPALDSDDFRTRMRTVGDRVRAARVAAVYLIHGTFVGTDALGLIEDLSRFAPQAAAPLRQMMKRTMDGIYREAGNYTPEYARLFEFTLSGDQARPIPVRLFNWTSENHHLGRASAAVRLIDELSRLALAPHSRVLLWAHSHGGNVLALLTNLIAADDASRDEFFSAGKLFHRGSEGETSDAPIWERVQRLLADHTLPFTGANLDLVTFGTPVRYGWDTDGYARLLHFIHHRTSPQLPEYRTHFPPNVRDVLRATGGDYVQHVGIAGTNSLPHLLAWRAWRADRQLNRLLQPGIRARTLRARLRLGQRVPDEGTTLLVNYGLRREPFARHLAGHGVYTHREWLLFHAEEVARRFYDSGSATFPVESTSSTP